MSQNKTIIIVVLSATPAIGTGVEGHKDPRYSGNKIETLDLKNN